MLTWLKSILPRRATKAAPSVMMVPLGRFMGRFRQAFTGWQDADLLRRFKGWVYVCIERRANALAALDWTFLEQTGIGSDGLPTTRALPRGHWLTMLAEHPTGTGEFALEWVTWREIVRQLEQYRCIYGRAFLWTPDGTEDGTGKYPVQAYVLPPNLTRPVTGESGSIEYFELQTPYGPKQLPRRSVAYLPVLAPGETLFDSLCGGKSMISAALDAIDADESATRFIADHFRHGAMPPVVITDESDEAEWTQEQWDSWLARWLEKHQSMGNQVPLAKLPKGWKANAIDLVTNLKNMLGIADRTMEMVARVFGIPLSMMKGNASNYATARVDNYIFRVDTIEPEAYAVEAILTRHFRRYDPNVTVAHVPAIDEDPEQVRADEKHLREMGVMTANDIALRRGLRKIPADAGGDTYYVPANMRPLNAPEPPDTPAPATDPSSGEGAPEDPPADDATPVEGLDDPALEEGGQPVKAWTPEMQRDFLTTLMRNGSTTP